MIWRMGNVRGFLASWGRSAHLRRVFELVHLHIGRKGCSKKRPRPPNKLQVLSLLCAACCGRFTPNVIRLWGCSATKSGITLLRRILSPEPVSFGLS
jgi:hypothetical protein